MIVIKTSIFPASKDEVFNKLQKLKLLQYIAVCYIHSRGRGNFCLERGYELFLQI